MDLKTTNNKDQIEKILKIFDKDFTRSISSRTGDLSSYAGKLANKALFMYMSSKYEGGRKRRRPIGFIAIYANDEDTKIAFLAQIAVSKEKRGSGIGHILLSEGCRRCKSYFGMEKMRLEVDSENKKAIKFYESHDFSIEKEASDESVFMIKNLL